VDNVQNIYESLPQNVPVEHFDQLLSQENVRIERIISHGHCTPAGQWYDQSENEWVMVLQGSGVIEYENGERVTLKTGDYLYLPAHLKHRVVSTLEHEHTVWLAIFWN
jgi:cupin 2 domain-containing protein